MKEKKKIRKGEIEHKLREIDENIALIEENLPRTLGGFLHIGLVKDGIYKKLEFMVENVIDICSILNADLSLGVPIDEEDIIKNLEIKRILSSELIAKIREMKGFRNILVHRYGKINDEIAFEILQNNLSDFQLFKKEILNILENKKGTEKSKMLKNQRFLAHRKGVSGTSKIKNFVGEIK